MREEYVGKTINRCIVVAEAGRGKYGRRYAVQCRCSTIVVKDRAAVRRAGVAILCDNCKRSDREAAMKGTGQLTHGETGNYLHMAWENMRRRCRGAWSNQRWKDKGVSVCPEWDNSYQAFADYVRSEIGERPSIKHSIDRIDNDGDYELGNIRWATKKQQAGNRTPGWKWQNRPNASPDVRDPVWVSLVGDLPSSMYTAELAVHLGLGLDKMRSILSVLGKRCLTKREALSQRRARLICFSTFS